MKRRKGLLDEEKFLPPLPDQLPRGVSSLPGYGHTSPIAQGLLGFTGRQPTYSVMDPEAQKMSDAYRLGEQASVASQLYSSIAPFAVAATLAKAGQIPGVNIVSRKPRDLGLDSSQIKPNAVGLKTIDTTLGPGVEIFVHKEDVSPMRFWVDQSGQAHLGVNPVLYGNKSFIKDRHFRAVDNFLWPYDDNVFARSALTPEDYNYLKSGTHRGSKNWHTGEEEGGLSVSRGHEAFMKKHGYLVRGKRIGEGSDSEPLLELSTAEPISRLMTNKELREKIQRDIQKKLKQLGITEDQIRALQSVPVLRFDSQPQMAAVGAGLLSPAVLEYLRRRDEEGM